MVVGDDAAAPQEASAGDAGVDAESPRDAAWVDVTALPVSCASQPCATSLVTTFGADGDPGEGFCALLSDGTVACWGANRGGQLGRGEDAATIPSSNAERVVGLSNIVKLDHTCAIDKDGAVWCWGTGPFLRDDVGAVTTERAPVKLNLPAATAVGVGKAAACAGTGGSGGGGEVLCWGSNGDGQLGPPSRDEDLGAPRPMPLPSGAPVRSITVGRATLVLREDGTMVTWGANPPIGRVSPFFPDPNPQSAALKGVFMLDLADDNACATAGGTGYCWGAPVVPLERGNGSITERGIPMPVVTPEPIVQMATTHGYMRDDGIWQRYRWCASSVSGVVYCLGPNDSGQAGDGTQIYAYKAVQVEGLKEQAADVKTTPNTTCALLTSGKIYCWGSNSTGQLGNGQVKGRSLVPVEVVLP
ncbi:hypothetical protein AKJ09_04464 [Labilithrix luteola]|uniref:BNR repeat domain protein n=1 Tax=Labilithrix luteola TaxID=1391654 RepID=A0A0K1PWA3_9BACT|nr:hypothetical protein [Labilithrix luteola]AKU97800.1 hypothetical protein AKJ09_04464 [Labilithrix luteola]